MMGDQEIETGLAGIGLNDGQTILLKKDADRFPDQLVVIDNQDDLTTAQQFDLVVGVFMLESRKGYIHGRVKALKKLLS